MTPADVAASVVSAASATLPFRSPERDAVPDAAHWTLAVLACAAVLTVILWGLRARSRRVGRFSSGSRAAIDLLHSRVVAPQVRLIVVRYGARQLLCAVTPGGLQCLRDEPNDDLSQAPQ